MYLKQGDLHPALVIDINADVTGATALEARIRKVHSTVTVTQTLVATDAANGILEYEWVDGDTDIEGTYLVDAVVTFADGHVQHFPQRSNLELIIKPEVGETVIP